MKTSFVLGYSLFFLASLPCFSETPGNHQEKDSLVSKNNSPERKYPFLWKQEKDALGTRTKEISSSSPQTQPSIDTNAVISRHIEIRSKNDSVRAAEIDDMIRYENDYMENKPGLDIARGKLVMNPYYENYAYFTQIDDPSPGLQPRPKRIALKWQISLQVPVVTLQYSNTGIFLAFTNRVAFDLFNAQDSRPVTHKTFMPEGFIRFDLAALTRKVSTDQVVFQFGAQHESNGGIDDSLSLLDSRNIAAKFYGQIMTKFFANNPDRNNRYLFVDKYRLILSARGFYSWNISENPDIVKYIGYFDLNGSYEFDPKIGLFNRDWYLGVFRLDGFFAPGGSTGPWFPSYSLGLSWNPPMFSNRSNRYEWLPKVPFTPYIRFFRGYNQYLIYYNKITNVFGWGIQLRR